MKLSREFAELAPVVEAVKSYRAAQRELEGLTSLIADPSTDAEMRSIAEAERPQLEARRATLEQQLRLALIPKDAMDDRNVILEIRAGTGGDEAALFAGDLFRMYERYAAKHGWKVEVMTLSEGSMGGFKEIIAEIRGRGAFAKLKYESGVHRVQRVPDTEASGRIHTSTATVAVLPEAQEVDVPINDADLRIDTLRAGGAGGQHVNKTELAVRVTHIPSGIVVMMQEDRSQHRNRAKAIAVLRTRLYDLERQKLEAARAAERRGQVGTGDRSERIRTYNFPQGRVSDHRINLTLYKLPQIMEGEALGRDRRRARRRASGGTARRRGRRMRSPAALSATHAGDGEAAAPTIAAVRRSLARSFRAAGVDSPELDARVLVGHALGLDQAALAAAGARMLDREARDAIDTPRAPALRARTGRAHRGQQGILEPEAFAHRRDAGAAAGDRNGRRGGARGHRCAEPAHASCAGSPISAPGAVRSFCALMRELPNAFGVGTDTSPRALMVARANARRLGVAPAAFIACDMAAALCGPFDLIVSNPPYIRSGDIDALAPEVRDFDPRAALDGGPDGLDCFRAIAAACRRCSRPTAFSSSNSAPGKRRPSAALFAAAGLAPWPPRTDLHGVPRALPATKRPRNRA